MWKHLEHVVQLCAPEEQARVVQEPEYKLVDHAHEHDRHLGAHVVGQQPIQPAAEASLLPHALNVDQLGHHSDHNNHFGADDHQHPRVRLLYAFSEAFYVVTFDD